MIMVDLDTASLARVRIAPSPVYEVTCWLAWAAAGRRHPIWGDPGAMARSALGEPAVAVAAALVRGSLTGQYVPDFLTPKPDVGCDPPTTQLAQQLERVRQTSPPIVHEQLRRAGAPPRWTAAADRLPALTAAGLNRFWSLAVAELSPRLERTLRRDRDRRAAVAADAGLEAVLSSLHPALRWHDGRLEVAKPYQEQVRYVDAEIVLVPSALAAPQRLAAQVCDPGDATLAYPALYDSSGDRGSLDTLLGAGRAAVLKATATGSSTQDLSRHLGLSSATVSRHLRILHNAGLVSRERQGHTVCYTQTGTAHQLLDSNR